MPFSATLINIIYVNSFVLTHSECLRYDTVPGQNPTPIRRLVAI